MSMDAADTAYDASRNVVWSGWYMILAGPRPRREHRLLRSASSLLLGAGVMMLAAAPVIGCWPLVEQAANAHVQAEQVRSVVAANWPQQERDVGELRRARAYNAAILASGQPTLGEPVDPFSGSVHGDFSGRDDAEYLGQLDDDHGAMAVIDVPSIGVSLPIGHGSDEATLERGAGHLHGTSLPVGGMGSHSVITAHRGLRDKLMFTRLDEMESGDLMYIRVEGETLAYRVDRIAVVEPDDTAALRASADEDRLTLMTCTPYGVNTHRLLVSGVRASIPDDAPPMDQAPDDGRFAFVIGGLTAFAAGAAGCTVIALRRCRRPIYARHAAALTH